MLPETPRRPWHASNGWLGPKSLLVTVVTWDSTKVLRCLNWLAWTGKLYSHSCYLRLHESLKWLAWTEKLNSHTCYLRLHKGLEMPQMIGLDRKAWEHLCYQGLTKPWDVIGWLGQESLLVTVVAWDSSKALRCFKWLDWTGQLDSHLCYLWLRKPQMVGLNRQAW